jgi:hypothetical protein
MQEYVFTRHPLHATDMIDLTPDASSLQPDHETASSETHRAISGSAASPEAAQMTSKNVPCNYMSPEAS